MIYNAQAEKGNNLKDGRWSIQVTAQGDTNEEVVTAEKFSVIMCVTLTMYMHMIAKSYSNKG